MRCLVGITATMVLVAGCCYKNTPANPTAPKSAEQKVKASENAIDSKVAAIVTGIAENADKPGVVKSESVVALAYLPPPSLADLNLVRTRIAKATPADYEKAVADAKKAKDANDALWSQMEVERAQSAIEIQKLKDEVKTAKHDADRILYTSTAVGLLALAGLAIAFSRYRAGIGLLVAGAGVGAVPYLLETSYFLPTLGVMFLVAFAFLFHHLIVPHQPDETPKP